MHRAACLSLVAWFSISLGWTTPLIADEPDCSQSLAPASVTTPGSSQAAPASSRPAEPSAPDPLGEATKLYRKGDFDHAIENYQRLLQESPSSPDGYAGLTRVYLKKKDVAHAFEVITKGLRAADSPTVRVALGEVYFRQGHISEAELEWVNVINSGYQNARAYMGLARVRWALSNYKSGWSMIDKAHELDPTDPDINKLWVGKLSRTERIKYWEEYLAGENNDDAETRANMQHYLEYLKARTKDPRGACHLVSEASTTETKLVPLRVDSKHLRGYGLSVMVNGKKSELLLDTGASGILINSKLAERAVVTNLSETEISGIGDKGNRSGHMGLANSLKVGELEFQNCPVRVVDQRSVTGEDGLVGADIFARFLVDIDFPNEKLHLTQLPRRPGETATNIALQTETGESSSSGGEPTEKSEEPESAKSAPPARLGPQDSYAAPEMQSYTKFYRFGHHLLLAASIGDAPVKLFLLDTGSSRNLISPSAAEEVTKVHGDTHAAFRGLSGSVKNVYRADNTVIQFGHLRQQNQDLLAIDLTHISDRDGTEVSGILGFETLRLLDIKIDYRDGLVDFSYDPKRWNH